jgi:methionine-rich copper-binding protein CopC
MPGDTAGSSGRTPVDSAPVTTPAPRHRRLTALLLGIAAAWLLSVPALGHASLVSSDPADGSSVPFPTTITLVFDDTLDAAKSQFEVIDATGAVAATGHVTATDAKTMQATGLSLTWGQCQVRWTAMASDGDLTRGTVAFFVIQQGAVSLGPGASAGAAPTTLSTPGTASTPVPSGDAAGSVGPAAGDVVLPIAAALVLVAVVGVVILRRSRAA